VTTKPSTHESIVAGNIHLTPGGKDEVHDVILKKTLNWEDLDNYLRTWSSLHTFHAKNPQDKEHSEGDIVRRLVKSLRRNISDVEANNGGDGEVPEKVEVEFPLALIMIKKAS
jgi:trans-aconitate 3-methyltransferase